MAEPTPIAHILPDVQRRAAERATKMRNGEIPQPEERVYDSIADLARTPPPIPARFTGADVAELDGDVGRLAGDWIADGMTSNVLLLGAVGVGKTHTACALAAAAWDAGRRVWFQPVVELLDQLRPGGDPHALDRATTIDVLVLDDLGGERPTDWTGERLYAIVNRRWLEKRPTIVTSNLDADALEKAAGPRVFSRLYHGAVRAKIGGTDRRRTPA